MSTLSTQDLVVLTQNDGIAVITIQNPPVNALSPGVPEGIANAIARIRDDASVRAAILIGANNRFIAGADIREFGKIAAAGGKRDSIGLNEVLHTIENCGKPVIAAIDGHALGGGLETAMACHYRIAASTAHVGQPECKLGLIPGAGGTQRLPRLTGLAKAAELCAFGDPVNAATAFELGIVDRVLAPGEDLLAGAIAFARETALALPLVRTRDKDAKLAEKPDFTALREAAAKRSRNLNAAQRAIDAVEAAGVMPFDEGLAYEQKLFMDCLYSDQSKALIHIFFGEREVAKVPGIDKTTPSFTIQNAAVIGAGTMGGGIAMCFANAGIPVRVKEASEQALERGMAAIRKNYANSVSKGRFSQETMDKRLALITPQLGYDGFDQADIVIEAVFEGMELKKEVFRELDAIAKPGAILASNTSTLSIDEIASATSRPESVIGTHFFSPANVMKLLEVVRGASTSLAAINTCMQLGKKLGKVSVLAGNCFGFIGNRMFGPYRREAQFLVEEGASVAAVDRALYDFGMAMGPLATGDLAGLDVGWRIRKEIAHLQKPGVRQPIAEDKLCEMGRFGQKTGAGWYVYDAQRKASVDPQVEAWVREWTTEVPKREIGEEEIVDRCLYALVNEGARILEEGFALRSVDIDIVYVNGYGFPAYRGGPMEYADLVGLDKVYARIKEFEGQHGELWTPAPLLVKLAEEGSTFGAYSKRASR
ncbi:MAG: enoyl-CoA hydratase/isomerase family protein [Acidobacteria bacterium]|nr:enoyl-CoA hydratase/isomerase family protein [Acidobacteriota bacterium]